MEKALWSEHIATGLHCWHIFIAYNLFLLFNIYVESQADTIGYGIDTETALRQPSTTYYAHATRTLLLVVADAIFVARKEGCQQISSASTHAHWRVRPSVWH